MGNAKKKPAARPEEGPSAPETPTGIPTPAPAGRILAGRTRDLAAQAAGYLHAVARDLDLLVSGIVKAPTEAGLCDHIDQKVGLVRAAERALEGAADLLRPNAPEDGDES